MSPKPGRAAVSARVLLVEEDPRAAMLIGEMLRAAWTGGLVVAHAQRFDDATQELLDHGATCVLVDIPAHDPAPLTSLEHLRSAAPDVPVIVLADRDDEDFGLDAVKAGAQDFLRTTELNPSQLARSVRYAIERKRSEVELAYQALHDPLTGLPNRALFIDRLTVALDRSRRTGNPVAVLFLDVDSFKQINDSLGHAAGDLLLTVLADRFHGMLRPMDTVARFGGDEFTFLFEEVDSEREAVLIADRIRRCVAEPLLLGDGEMTIAASIGITIVNEPAVSPDTVIRDADAAMYRAKEHGGDRFELFDETSRHRATERLELEEALRHAMEHGELRVHYQPQVSLAGDTGLSGFEALVRWQHPERGLMDAREFVALAETTGLIVPIGEWVLGQALQEVTRWREQRPDVTVSVNMSARQLADPGLEATLAASLRESGADPATLSLEVTESAVLDDLAQNGATLDSLRRLGVRLTVDDFGTGRTSVQSLRRLPLQEVKIAPSFVRGLGGDGEERALLGALVELGHALGVTVVAEGVETDAQLVELRELGCDGAQGYLFSRPVPEEGVQALLASGSATASC